MNYDIIIPIAEGDFQGFKSKLTLIRQHLKTENIIVIGTAKLQDRVKSLPGCIFIDEDNVCSGLTFACIRDLISKRYPKAVRRTGWYFQQFIKLAYSYQCKNRYYLTWDSDTILTKDLSFFNKSGRPYMDYLPSVKYDKGYFKLLDKISTDKVIFSKKQSDSFITEHMLFDCSIVKNMLEAIESNDVLPGKYFFEKIINAIPLHNLNLSGFSEFETYAAFVYNNAPETYVYRRWNNLRNGAFYIGFNPTDEQLRWVSESFDVVSLEDYDSHHLFFKISLKFKINRIVKFKTVYRCINPMYKMYYNIRMCIRQLLKK